MTTEPAMTATKPATRKKTPTQESLAGSRGSKLFITQPTAPGICVRIPAAMMSETPLPMPCLSICSPSHMRNMQPAVRAATAMTHQTTLPENSG